MWPAKQSQIRLPAVSANEGGDRLPAHHRSFAPFSNDQLEDALRSGLAFKDDAYMRSILSHDSPYSSDPSLDRLAALPESFSAGRKETLLSANELLVLAQAQTLYALPTSVAKTSFDQHVAQQDHSAAAASSLAGNAIASTRRSSAGDRGLQGSSHYYGSNTPRSQQLERLWSSFVSSSVEDSDQLLDVKPCHTLAMAANPNATANVPDAHVELRMLEQQHTAKMKINCVQLGVMSVKSHILPTPQGDDQNVVQPPPAAGNNAIQLAEQPRLKPNIKPENYKTELCHNWEEVGTCHLGEKCLFAHGEAELRHRERHPLYKTKPCATFIRTGKCDFGKRCTYMHPSSLNTKKDDVFDSSKRSSMLERFGLSKKSVSTAAAMMTTATSSSSTSSSWNASSGHWSDFAFPKPVMLGMPSRMQSDSTLASASSQNTHSTAGSAWPSSTDLSSSVSRRDSSASSSLSTYDVMAHKGRANWHLSTWE